MYYEDLLYRTKLKDEVREQLKRFYDIEHESTISSTQNKDQLTAISTYNLMRICYCKRNEGPELVDRHFKEVLDDLKFIFLPVNQEDLFITRLENFCVRLVLMFGMDVIKELEDDFISYLILIDPDKKYQSEPFKVTKIHKKSQEQFEINLRKLCATFHYLWMLPFFSEFFMSKS